VQTEKKIYNTNDTSDPDFASILAQEARTRFMNRDGAFTLKSPQSMFVNRSEAKR
jgi:hypothetical protein